jgi:hypothetical protein
MVGVTIPSAPVNSSIQLYKKTGDDPDVYRLKIGAIELLEELELPEFEMEDVVVTTSGSDYLLSAPDLKVIIPDLLNIEAAISMDTGTIITGNQMTLHLAVDTGLGKISVAFTGSR